MSGYRLLPIAACVLLLVTPAAPAPAADTAACRELERKFDLIKPDMVSIQLNAALFSAADAGCEALAQRLLAAGASLEARDRLCGRPPSPSARGRQRAL